MSQFAANIVFLASACIGVSIWLMFDRFYVRPQNQLLERFNKADAVEATVVASRGGWLRSMVLSAATSLGLGSTLRRRRLSKAQRSQLFELPDLVDLLAVAMSSGDGLLAALERVGQRSSGIVADDLKRVVLGVQLGGSLSSEISSWSRRANSRQIAELCTKLQLSLARGTPLAEMLTDQAASLRAEVQQLITLKAGQNETKMLVPLIFLILPVTVLFAVYPSLQVLSITQ